MALCAFTSLANPTPDLYKRYTKTRLTQFADNLCATPSIFEDKSWSVGCVDIDGTTNGFNMALGTGPRGHCAVRAFSETGSPAEADMGEIPELNGEEPDTGACVDANNYMITLPNFYGHCINSVKFV